MRTSEISLTRRFTSFTVAERISVAVALLVLAILALSGCKSKEEKAQEQAVDQAKQQVMTTGQPQQVVTTDKQGHTTVTVVRPPAPGTREPIVTTTTTTAPGVPVTARTTVTNPDGTVSNAYNNTVPGQYPAQPADGSAPASAPAPGQTVVRPLDVTLAEGTALPVRINQTINVKHVVAGQRFSGSVADSIRDDNGRIVVPRGTPVSGVISQAHKRGHFKGSSILSLRLTSMTLDGQNYSLSTSRMTETKKGKGKRTAGWIGGGAGAGALIGGIASGGVGLLVGGLAGGGAGTAVAGLTGNKDLVIPAESIVRFRLAEPLNVVPAQ